MNAQLTNLNPCDRQPPEFRVHRPQIPWVPHYLVVAGPTDGALAALLVGAERIARTEALAQFGDPECFSLIVNAGRTRRVPWPHVHILLAPSPAKKRRAMFWLALKHLTRPARWFAAARPQRRSEARPMPVAAPAEVVPQFPRIAS